MIKQISVEQTAQMLMQKEVVIVDIRDSKSFQQGHIPNAIHLDDSNLQIFLTNTEQSKPIVVCCYHGHSSQKAAEFFYQQGFEDSYSMDGGMTAWAMTQKMTVEKG